MAELAHSGHDFSRLLCRWESFAERSNWKLSTLAESNSHKVLALQNPMAAEGAGGGLYISAGVHGDECAPVWAVLRWCEEEGFPEDRSITIFPCLNPHGLIENTRNDHLGFDMNRCFQDRSHPVIGAWMEFLQGRKFDVAVNLHEDYDATGIYLYELARSESFGDRLLSACQDVIPREIAALVDGSDFKDGLLQRDVAEKELERVVDEDLGGGWPEAIWLYVHHARNSFTFETPSEMALERRIEAHLRFLKSL